MELTDSQYRDITVGKHEVTVVVPTLSEAEGIGQVLDDLKEEGFERVLVVDGRSSDGTPQIAAEHGASVIYQHGRGKAGAIRTALDVITTQYMAVMDGDCTYSASDLLGLLSCARDYTEVIGARTKGRENIPLTNRFGNWLVSKAYKLLFAAPISDVLSGMYVVRADILRAEGLSSESFDVEVEIASTLVSAGKVTQVPISYGSRKGEEKLGARHGFRILNTLFWMTYYESPLYMFGLLSVILGVPAVGTLFWVLYEVLRVGVFHSGVALFGVMLFLFVSQGMSVALVSLVTKRSEHRLRRAIENHRDS